MELSRSPTRDRIGRAHDRERVIIAIYAYLMPLKFTPPLDQNRARIFRIRYDIFVIGVAGISSRTFSVRPFDVPLPLHDQPHRFPGTI